MDSATLKDRNRMSIARKVFLDWNQPGLPAIAEYLLHNYSILGIADLGNLVVVLPGKRAGRRLLEILVERADDGQFTPPQITTVGRLPELLYESKKPFAGDFVQKLAWVDALKAVEPERLQRVIPVLPPEDDIDRWLSLGELLWRTHRELAADGLDFRDVSAKGPLVDGFDEGDRWSILRGVQEAYLRQLDELDLWDMQTSRLFAIEFNECRTDREIILAGTVDTNRAMRRMLAQVGERVTALIHAPQRLHGRFDEFGCLRSDAWQNVPLDLDTRNVRVVDGPADQADTVARTLAGYDGKYRPDDITIGVADERLVPQIQRQLDQCDVPTRWVVGNVLAETGPYRLLNAVGAYLERGRFDDFAALVRHPDLYQWIEEQGIDCRVGTEKHASPASASKTDGGAQSGLPKIHWLQLLDDYNAQHLQPRLGEWLGSEHRHAAIRQVHGAVEALLSPFRESTRALSDWSEPCVTLLLNVYAGRRFDLDRDGDRVLVDATKRIHQTLVELTAIPEALMPQVSAADAIRLTLGQIASHPIPSAALDTAVELLGWLELPLDDAPALVVTTFNEGHVPKSLNADLFLPNRLRKQLGLDDNSRRYARDAYALNVLLHSRESLTLIVGRRDAQDDPLKPSRLLFATKPQAIASRVLAFFGDDDRQALVQPPLAGEFTVTREESGFSIPRPRPLAAPIERMSVTSFRTYLTCPYRFYLRHALRLAPASDDARELDAMSFGNLTHEVLNRFGKSDHRDSQDAKEIRTFLRRALDGCVDEWYGKSRLAPVNVQIMQLRARLDAFADWQADWAAQGWRIRHSEVSFANHNVGLQIDDERWMQLDGRVDRIDQLADSNEWIVFDYKTGESGTTPQASHRNRDGWVDLQLPLYRHLARSLGIDGDIKLGYIVLPKDTAQVDRILADWDDDQLAEADMVASMIARCVTEERFWPPLETPRGWFQEYAAICQDGVFDRRISAEPASHHIAAEVSA
ncbi:MAG: PD-(D/E)XK nuclease family protein [Planctomycetota bacterium]|nr:PD-(D/E)XK nuclease family protein [Planctomycetota bacterium]